MGDENDQGPQGERERQGGGEERIGRWKGVKEVREGGRKEV